MSLSALPLSYCTNVHPGATLDEVLTGLERHAAAVQQRRGGVLGVGLWLSRAVLNELADPDKRRRLCDWPAARQMTCYTLNAFPFGNFHDRRVKENVYRPDWADPARTAYTLAAAELLADLLPERGEGSISTLPLSFKPFHAGGAGATEGYQDNLIAVARALHGLYRKTGKRIRLAVEPEPFCTLESTPETLTFFTGLFARADAKGLEPVVREYIGLCYDVCHQAVEFEDVAAGIQSIDAAGIRLNKIHITCALELRDPKNNADGRRRLAEFAEERYLHQTFARLPDGRILKAQDLTAGFAADPPAEWLEADAWRVHFHVPVGAETLGPLQTTRDQLRQALGAAAELPYAPHLEVETYTWEVLPEARRRELAPDLAAGLAAELAATDALLDELRPNSGRPMSVSA